MALASASFPARRILLAGGLTICLAILSVWIARVPVHLPLLGTAASILFMAALLNADAGLVILVLSMLFSPQLAVGHGGGTSLETSRAVTLRTDDLVLLLIGVAWIARMAMHKDLGAVRRTRLNGAIAAYAAICLLSTLIGIEAARVRPLVGLCFVAKYIEYFIIFFITVNYVRSEEQHRRLLAAVLVTASLIVLYAYWQMPSGVRPSAPFEGKDGEPNTLGGYLVLMFSVSAAIALTVPERRWRRPCALLAAATIPPLLATLSRSSWLAFGSALATLLILSPARRRLAALAIVGATLLLFLHPKSVEERIAYTFEGDDRESLTLGHVRLDSSSSARLTSWGSALEGFVQHPVTGWGITGYGFLDAQYFRVLVELGIPGLAAFGVLLWAVARLCGRSFAVLEQPLHRALGLGMTAGLAGLLVHAIGTNTFILIRIMEPFWLLCGLCIAALELEGKA